ncbi:hypothetical protein NDK43_21855 [Neobacillus pocheonensis]|uniref:Uncharacterized protein n=1 Tax=Neobacillus pocheonensis TaxID=363869 RepID=A0ABT0WDV7_9BACI|nr:hypothetical protein [Neobacillus pocheonensis]
MDYSYKEFLEDLNMGREVEFTYKGDKYYISSWGFWRFYDDSSEITISDEENILEKVKLDGKSILEIWNLIEINIVY